MTHTSIPSFVRLDDLHTVVKLSKRCRENLLKLAAYLMQPKLKAKFTMSRYTEAIGVSMAYEGKRTECGSVGCAVGHGPYAGVVKERGDDWQDYGEREFTDYKDLVWDWLFDCDWAHSRGNRSPKSTAKRIYYMLEHGIPESFGSQTGWRKTLQSV